MYSFAITITTSDGSEEIKIGHGKDNSIGEVSVMLDTLDNNVAEKSNAMLTRVHIKGAITKENNAELMKVFAWSKSFKAALTYRKITIDIKSDEETGQRTYEINKVFVRDFKESYTNNTEKGDKGGEFVLELTQQQNNLEEAKTY